MSGINQGVPMMTTTEELFLPTRLVYEVFDAKRLRARLEGFSCMAWNSAKRGWSWEYEGPVRQMGFPAAYNRLPEEQQPIVLAWCYLVDDQTFHVYTRCGFRAVKFLEFFDRKVSRKLADGKFIDEYNLMTTVALGFPPPTPEDFFRDESRLEFTDIAALIDLPEFPGKKQAVAAQLAGLVEGPLQPLVRHRLEKFYRDGPVSMQQSVRLRQLLAMEQSKSRKPIRPFDVIARIIRGQDDNSSGGPPR